MSSAYQIDRGDLKCRVVDDEVLAQSALWVVVCHVTLEVIDDVSFCGAVFFNWLPTVAALGTALVVVHLLDCDVLPFDSHHTLLAVETVLCLETTLAVQHTVGLEVIPPVLVLIQLLLALTASEVFLVEVLLLSTHNLLVCDRLIASETDLLVVLFVTLLAQQVPVLFVENVGRELLL